MKSEKTAISIQRIVTNQYQNFYKLESKSQELISTLFQVQNCHVVRYIPRHEYNGKMACVIVGAGHGNPYLKNENYIDYCLEAGLSPKAKVTCVKNVYLHRK